MGQVVKFGFEVNSTAGLVAGENGMKMGPDAVSSGVRNHYHVEELIGNSGVDPHKHGEILANPIWIIGVRSFVSDMGAEIEAPKNDKKESTPLGVIVGMKVQIEGEKGFDIHNVNSLRDRNSRGGG